MTVILDGEKIAKSKKVRIKQRVQQLKSKGINPTLSIVMVGDREDSVAYTRGASKALSSCGINCKIKDYPETISQEEFIENIGNINNSSDIHGILIMRPIPKHINWHLVENAVVPEKDVDCITPVNLAGVFQGKKDVFYPCTAKAVMNILEYYQIDIEGKKAVVIGRSLVVGKPVAMMLLDKNATVTICHSKTVNLLQQTSRSDILVAAVGVPGLVKREHVKEGGIVIDVGISWWEMWIMTRWLKLQA